MNVLSHPVRETSEPSERKRIFHRRHDPLYSRRDDRFGAGPRAAGMRTGLERAVERGAARELTSLVQRMNFRVRLARALMRAVADDDAFIGDDGRADDGIRRGAAKTTARLFQRAAHPPPVLILYHFSWNSAST